MDEQIEFGQFVPLITAGARKINDRIGAVLGDGLRNYYNSQYEKYFYTKNFLFRSEKKRFYDVYFPVKAEYERLETDLSDFEDVTSEYSKIMLLGTAGSGKSSLIRHIFLQALTTRINKIPILVELRNLNEFNGSFEEFLYETAVGSKIKPSNSIFSETLDKGKVLFLFDGYDEVYSVRKPKLHYEIERFIDAHNGNDFIITSRPGAGVDLLPRFHNFNVLPLKRNEISEFIIKMVDDADRQKRMLDVINDPNSQAFDEYLKSPLLLSMFILAFESHPEVPSTESSFYYNVFDTLYSRHDAWTKGSYTRERISRLNRSQFETILQSLCFHTFRQGLIDFTTDSLLLNLTIIQKKVNFIYEAEMVIKDLTSSICILIEEGFTIKFPHRSLQEYFAAVFIRMLPTNSKTAVYENLETVFPLAFQDQSHKFLSLCLELDRIMFLKYFILPKFDLILSCLPRRESSTFISEFMEYLTLEWILIGQPGSHSSGSFKLRSFSFIIICSLIGVDFWRSLLSLVSRLLNDVDDLAEWENSAKASNFGPENFVSSKNLFQTPAVIQRLDDSDLPEAIQRLIDKIQQKIVLMQTEVDRAEDGNDALISMIYGL